MAFRVENNEEAMDGVEVKDIKLINQKPRSDTGGEGNCFSPPL